MTDPRINIITGNEDPHWLRLPKRDTWHFHPACRWYIRAEDQISRGVAVVIKYSRPTTGELCNECQAKRRKDQGTHVSH